MYMYSIDAQYCVIIVLPNSFQCNVHSYQSVAPGAEGGAPVETRSGRWLRFNDIIVDEFVMSDSALEAECFGGSYKPKSTDGMYVC